MSFFNFEVASWVGMPVTSTEIKAKSQAKLNKLLANHRKKAEKSNAPGSAIAKLLALKKK